MMGEMMLMGEADTMPERSSQWSPRMPPVVVPTWVLPLMLLQESHQLSESTIRLRYDRGQRLPPRHRLPRGATNSREARTNIQSGLQMGPPCHPQGPVQPHKSPDNKTQPPSTHCSASTKR